MLLYHFNIPMRLPSYNEYDNLIKRNKYAANKFKQEIEGMIMMCMPSIKDTITEEGLLVEIVWHEPNRRRDLDNIVFCKKFIFDALQKKGIIKNDKQILYLREEVPKDKEKLVEISIYSTEEHDGKRNGLDNQERTIHKR